MMVVMLVVAIILAATAPMITKKVSSNRKDQNKLWEKVSGSPAYVTTKITNDNARLSAGFFSNTEGVGLVPDTKSVPAKSVVIGLLNASTSIGSESVGIGIGVTPSTKSVAIGNSTMAEKEQSIAIGYNARTYKEDSIAIGYNAYTFNKNSVAIGANSKAYVENTIVLGTKDTAVYIPGYLVVDGGIISKGSILTKQLATEKRDGYPNIGTGLDFNSRNSTQNINELDNDYDGKFNINTEILEKWLSDIRLKDVGEKYTAGLDEISKIDLYNYTYKNDEKKTPQVGVIAQDLQKIFPNAVTTGIDGYLRIRWDEMFYATINAVKQLNEKVVSLAKDVLGLTEKYEQQQAQIDAQQKINDEQSKIIRDLETRINKLERQK